VKSESDTESELETSAKKPSSKKPKLINPEQKRKSDGATASEESTESFNKSKESNYDADEDTDYESLDKSKEVTNCLDDSKEITPSKHFKLLSWNIDGLDAGVVKRAAGVVATILK
jgi:hypothetical protein